MDVWVMDGWVDGWIDGWWMSGWCFYAVEDIQETAPGYPGLEALLTAVHHTL